MDLKTFIIGAMAWLDEHAAPLGTSPESGAGGRAAAGQWGIGSDSVEVFPPVRAPAEDPVPKQRPRA